MTKQEQQERLNALYSEKQNLLNELQSTDYIAAKIAEGKATKTEYKAKIGERQGWRDRINAIQSEIISLSEAEIEEEVSAE